MSESDSNYTTNMYEEYMGIVLIDFWLFFTGVLNLATNVLIIYSILKAKLRKPLHWLLLNISVTEIINQLFCPTVFKMFALSHDIFKDFTNHKVFTSMYFSTLYLIILCMFMLLLRNYCKCIDRFFMYIIGSIWIIGIISFYIIFQTFSSFHMRNIFIPPYIICLALLFIAIHVHQIRATFKSDAYSGRDYQISMMYVSTYVVARLGAIMLFALGELLYGFIPLNSNYFFIGCVQLVSIANFFILYKFDENFKNCSLAICGRQVRRTDVNGFQNLHEENALPE